MRRSKYPGFSDSDFGMYLKLGSSSLPIVITFNPPGPLVDFMGRVLNFLTYRNDGVSVGIKAPSHLVLKAIAQLNDPNSVVSFIHYYLLRFIKHPDRRAAGTARLF